MNSAHQEHSYHVPIQSPNLDSQILSTDYLTALKPKWALSNFTNLSSFFSFLHLISFMS